MKKRKSERERERGSEGESERGTRESVILNSPYLAEDLLTSKESNFIHIILVMRD